MKDHVYRLPRDLDQQLSDAAEAKGLKRYQYVNEVLQQFLSLPVQPIAPRPHLRGRGISVNHKQVIVKMADDTLAAIAQTYPDLSVSVVLQAALERALSPHPKEGPVLKVEPDTRKRVRGREYAAEVVRTPSVSKP